jgi:two-component system phosphate regulon response regulator PhoB
MAASILIVEDEPAILELVAVNLEHAGYETLRAKSAEDAAQMLIAELPDLVLLDWMLPGQSGLSLARRLRADARTRELPIIFLTARAEELDKIAGLEVGADD